MLTGNFDKPDSKKLKSAEKRPNLDKALPASKKTKTVQEGDIITRVQHPILFKFYTVNEQWQRHACAQLGLEFVNQNRVE